MSLEYINFNCFQENMDAHINARAKEGFILHSAAQMMVHPGVPWEEEIPCVFCVIMFREIQDEQENEEVSRPEPMMTRS